MYKFSWWKDEANSKAVTAIIGALKVVLPAGIVTVGFIVAYVLKDEIAQSSEPSELEAISMNGGGSRASGEALMPQRDNFIVNQGYTVEQHQQILAQREMQLRIDLDRATNAERALIEQELAAVVIRLNDVQTSYAEAVEELSLLRQQIDTFEGQVPTAQLEAAILALNRGDRSLADALFAQVEELVADQVKRVAYAAFHRGEIAEADVRWADAAKHYGRAASVDPGFETLRRAIIFARRSGDYPMAEYFGVRLLEVSKKSEDLQLLAAASNQHALTLQVLGRFEQAEALLVQVIEIDRKTLGDTHPVYAKDLSSLAGLLYEMGRYGEAEQLYRQALELVKRSEDELDADYASRLSNLANLLRQMERYDEAEPMFLEALDIARTKLGSSHPIYASHLNNYAELLRQTGRSSEAEPYYHQALEIVRRTLGENHPSYAVSLNNIGEIMREAGRNDEATTYYVQALEILNSKLGIDHPSTTVVRANLEQLNTSEND